MFGISKRSVVRVYQPPSMRPTSRMDVHSNDTGASLIRGTATRSDGVNASPASRDSSLPFGNAIEVVLICCASENRTRLTTNCSLARILARGSFGWPENRLPIPTPAVAGSDPKTFKKENGAAFTSPPAWRVGIHTIGFGQAGAGRCVYA